MVRKVKAKFSKGKIEPLEHLSLHEGQEIVISVEETPAPETRSSTGGKFFLADSLLKLAGTGQGKDVTDVSRNKHKYIAEAYGRKDR